VKKTLTTIFDYRFEKIHQLFPVNEEKSLATKALDTVGAGR